MALDERPAIIIAINDTTSEIFIEDLGIGIPANDQIALTDYFELWEISASGNLRTEITLETIIINDSISNLSVEDATFHVRFRTVRDDVEGTAWHENTIFTSCVDFSVFININGHVMRSIL